MQVSSSSHDAGRIGVRCQCSTSRHGSKIRHGLVATGRLDHLGTCQSRINKLKQALMSVQWCVSGGAEVSLECGDAEDVCPNHL